MTVRRITNPPWSKMEILRNETKLWKHSNVDIKGHLKSGTIMERELTQGCRQDTHSKVRQVALSFPQVH